MHFCHFLQKRYRPTDGPTDGWTDGHSHTALLGKYLLNYRYSYMHYYGKVIEYLIKDSLRKNSVTMIIILHPKFAVIMERNSDNIQNFL